MNRPMNNTNNKIARGQQGVAYPQFVNEVGRPMVKRHRRLFARLNRSILIRRFGFCTVIFCLSFFVPTEKVGAQKTPAKLLQAAASAAPSPVKREVPERCCQAFVTLEENEHEVVLQVEEHGDYTYLLSQVYTKFTSGSYGIFTKLDRRGSVEWRLRTEVNGQFTAFVRDKKGFILTGGRQRSGPQPLRLESSLQGSMSVNQPPANLPIPDAAILMRVDADGTIDWSGEYFYRGFDNLILSSDNSTVYFTSTRPANPGSRIVVQLFKATTSNGIVSTVREVGRKEGADAFNSFFLREIFEDEDGNILLFGNAGLAQAQVIRVNDAGQLLSSTKFAGVGQFVNHRMEQVVELTGNKYLMCGYVVDGGVDIPYLWLVQQDGGLFTVLREVSLNEISGGVKAFDAIAVRDSGWEFAYISATTQEGKSAVYSVLIWERLPDWYMSVSKRIIKSSDSDIVVDRTTVGISSDEKHLVFADSRRSTSSVKANVLVGEIEYRINQDCTEGVEMELRGFSAEIQGESTTGVDALPFGIDYISESTASKYVIAELRDCPPDLLDGCLTPYPIATSGRFQFTRPTICPNDEEIKVEITDALGWPIRATKTFGGGQPIEFDLSGERVGIYYIKIHDSTGKLLHVASVRIA